MAFNPFSWFRDHQKGMIIGLIGLAMLVFIGSYGRGDIFDRLLGYFGASRASGEVVTSIYGKKVREGDISRMAFRRKAASEFLNVTVAKGHDEVSKDLTKRMAALSKDSPDLKESPTYAGIPRILQEYQSASMQLQMLSGPQGRQFGQQIQQMLERYIGQIGQKLRDLEAGASKPNLTPENRFVFQQVATLLGFQRHNLARNPTVPYFGGSTTEDILDFRLWQLQADRLGIKLTDADVIKEIIGETAGSELLTADKSFADQEPVKTFMAGRGREKNSAFTAADLMDSLREEFRVVMAQGALLGVEPGVRAYRAEMSTSATPSLATPDEFLEFYREQRTALRVKMFPITAESYLSQVKEVPTETELLARFDRGAKVEPMPFSREPGFKLSRRVKVEYVVASSDDAFYKEQARKDAETLRKLSEPEGRVKCVFLGLLAPGVTKMVNIALDPLGKEFDALLSQDYSWFYDTRDNLDTMEKKSGKVHDSSVINPVSIASLVGGSFGGPTLSGLVATRPLWYYQEVRQSVPFNLHLMLSQSNPQNLLGAAIVPFEWHLLRSDPDWRKRYNDPELRKLYKEPELAAFVAHIAQAQAIPAETPRSLFEPQIVAAKQVSLAENALRANFLTMETEMGKLSKKPAEARAYIAKAVQDYKLSIHSMPTARTPQDLIEDLKNKKNTLNLDLLRAGILNDLIGTWSLAQNKPQDSLQFVRYLLQGNGSYAAIVGGHIPDSKQELLFWRSEDLTAQERTFPQVRDEVVAAWRLEKARALARKKAEELEAKVNKPPVTPADAERFLREQKLTSFELENVSQYAAPSKEVLAGITTDYRPYQVPEDKFEELPFPPQDFVKQLMKLERPGDATVIVDMPAKTYYVAVLVDRTEPSLADFKSVYVRSPGSDPMYMRLQGLRREEYRKAVVEQFRRDANSDLDKEGRFKIPESMRKGDASQFEGE